MNQDQAFNLESLPSSLDSPNMNQTQVSSLENLPPSFTSFDMNQEVSSSENLPPSFTLSNMNQTQVLPSVMNRDQVCNMDNIPPSFVTIYPNSQDNNALPVSPQNGFHVATATHPQYDNTQTLPQQILPFHLTSFHPTNFFYRPPNDFCHYYISCKEISYDIVECLLNKSLKENNVQYKENGCIFYYQQQYNARFYQVSCEIVSPLLINKCLNKNFLGIEFQQNTEKEKLVFTFEQKENLEDHLKQYLSQYLLK
ncbi:hypothetical protein RclHR1_00920006 [Rhizophagus clarus]|uniref:Uncharacterized protein n=1 Tax=Rhizophagus clarus TaxID=94130 RepID=A0A2Z6S3A5_9GLOM|nr:hypothetical protein RclHR1_00920006 [Rhizophagus clarus]GES73800.1 hypothetical protein GLOIN_2v1828169 [Rhizophagus clarus]